MSDEKPYTPSEAELMEAWIVAHSEPGWGGPVDIGGRPKERIAEGRRAIEAVKNDALREAALSGLFGANAQRTLLHMAGEETP